MRIFKVTLTGLVGSLIAALFFLGCGGGESLTKAEFIEQADAICLKAEKEKQEDMEAFLLKSSAGSAQPLTLKEQLELATDAILPQLRFQADELTSLAAPDGEEDQASTIVTEFGAVVSDLEKSPLPLASTQADPFTTVAEKARDYGFKTCILNY